MLVGTDSAPAARYYAGRALLLPCPGTWWPRGKVTKRRERQRHEVKGVVDKDMPILRNFA